MSTSRPTPGAVHIWTAVVDREPAVLASLTRLLDNSERAKTKAFRFDQHRGRHVFRRAMTRAVLGAYLETDPSRLVFDANPFGKPLLAPRPSDCAITFNLSHSGDLVVMAVTCGREVGVDVETMRTISDSATIARHYFAPAERAKIANAPAADRDGLFLRLWTRKEAYVKAVGRGLSMPLDSFDVCGDEVSSCSDRTVWSLSDLRLRPGYVGAVAVPGGTAEIACSKWTPCA